MYNHGICPHVKNIVILSSQDVYAQFGRLNGHEASIIEDVVTEFSPLTIPFPFRGIADHEGGLNYDKKDVEELYQNNKGRFDSITSLRLPAVYGTGDSKRRFGAIIDALDSNKKLPCQNRASWRWTLGHVENIAHSIVLSAEKCLPGYNVFNVGESETTTFHDRVHELAKLMNVTANWEEVDKIEAEFSVLGNMPNDFVVDTSKIRNQLGYIDVLPNEDRYNDLINWCRSFRE